MILIDADVLGRQRTGDETYVLNLLRELPVVAPDLELAAVTRRPELVPPGIEPIELSARLSEARMAYTLPRLLARLKPQLAHFQYFLPLGWRGLSVVTVHDLSFEGPGSTMGLLDRAAFRALVPRAVRRADHVLAVSERTKRDILARYGVAESKVTVTPNGVDPAFAPGGGHDGYVLFVGAIQKRKDPLSALAAARAVDLPLVVAGPEKDAELAAPFARAAPICAATWPRTRLPTSIAAPRCSCCRRGSRGSGCRCSRRWPVARRSSPPTSRRSGRSAESGGLRRRRGLRRRGGEGARRAAQLSAAGIERAKAFSWKETARRTAEVYRQVLA